MYFCILSEAVAVFGRTMRKAARPRSHLLELTDNVLRGLASKLDTVLSASQTKLSGLPVGCFYLRSSS